MKHGYTSLTSLVVITMLCLGFAVNVNAHMDHDRARFVAPHGSDHGDCKNRFRPCASISYAAKQADKGDSLLFAQGTYSITDVADIFHLVSDIVPAYGGFQPLDNYQVQNPNQFPTTLIGVPQKYAQLLFTRGFNVIADRKGLESEQAKVLKNDLAKVDAMHLAQSQTACEDNLAGAFPCNQISLLAHVPRSALPTSSSTANDIWGHVDLNTMKEYALIGLRRGIAVVDVSEPTQPIVVGSVSGNSTTWRDIKVYQFYSNTLNKWQAFAYATADSSSEGLTIIDLNSLETGVTLVNRQLNDPSAHNIYISGVDYSLNIANTSKQPRVHILGAQSRGGSLKSYSLENPRSLINTYNLLGASRADYTHDASSLLINDIRATRDCINGDENGCLVMLDFNENSLRLWDHTLETSSSELSESFYPNTSYAHSGWWTEDKQFVLLHDELDERDFSLPTTVHIFDISDLSNPVLAGTWKGPTGAIDHNGFVLGNKYYMSNYERGLTVLDISTPSAPQEIVYFDTFPSSDNTSFNGAWGVYPYLPSGSLLVSDIQGGLYILKDETDSADKANISFESPAYQASEGETLSIVLAKAGAQAATIDYQVILGSTQAEDLELAAQGSIEWSIDDETNKSIDIQVLEDGLRENTETFFVRLFNPSADAEIKGHFITAVEINSLEAPSSVFAFDTDELQVKEIDGQISVAVNRSGSANSALQLNVSLQDINSSSADYKLLTETLNWEENDVSSKLVLVDIVNDEQTEDEERFTLVLSSPLDNVEFASSTLIVSILDDESNAAPTVLLSTERVNVNPRQTVSITAVGNDPENSEIAYYWEQTAGDALSLMGTNDPTLTFVASDSAQTLSFTVSVSDDFDKVGTASVDVIVEEPAAPPPPAPPVASPEPTTNTSSSGGAVFWVIGLLLIACCRRVWN